MEETDNCAICLEGLLARGRQQLSCGHVFHEVCVFRMRQYGASDRCPLCCSACSDLRSANDLISMAFVCDAQRQFAEEARLLEEALTIEPSSLTGMVNLGVLCLDGKGVAKNVEKARELFEEARRGGDPMAACNLGKMYFNGKGVSKNVGRALELFEEARRGGHTAVARYLGEMYLNGVGVARNFDKARELFEEARSGGEAAAAFNLGTMYFDGMGVAKNVDKARELLGEARRGGVAGAATILGTMYLNGEGVAKDVDKARELLEEARNGGEATAAFNLGKMYFNGMGVAKNVDKGRELFEEARMVGVARAASNLGAMYLHGVGVAKNFDKARELFEEARNGGEATAAFNLGKMYFNGMGVAKNVDKGRELFEEARRGGVAAAARNLGAMYLGGMGVAKDVEKAREFLEEAHRGGDADAVKVLASIGVLQNLGMAGESFETLCQSGVADLVSDAGSALHQAAMGHLNAAKSFQEASISPAKLSCAACGAQCKKMQECTGCRRAWYCSAHCQRRDWRDHKELCQRLRSCTRQAKPSPQQPGGRVEGSKPATSASATVELSSSELHLEQSGACFDYEAAVKASLDEVNALASPQNEQVARAILEDRLSSSAPRGVILLEFSRNPMSYHERLMQCEELRNYRDALTDAGVPWLLPSLAKVFVRTSNYDAALEALRIFGLTLEARHVLAEPELEDSVVNAAENRAERIRLSGRGIVPLGFAGASMQADAKVNVTRTFVHLKIPSSLCSEHSGPVTASTTDAHSRFGQNVRAHGTREARSPAGL